MNRFVNWKEHIPAYVLLLVFSAIVTVFQNMAGTICFLATFYYIFYDYRRTRQVNSEITEYVEGLNDSFDEITRGAVFAVPFPLVIIDDRHTVTWYNTNFKELIRKDVMLNRTAIEEVLDFEDLSFGEEIAYVETYIDKKLYRFFVIELDNNTKGGKLHLLYGIDYSDIDDLDQQLKHTKLCIAEIFIDNYDEIVTSTSETKRALLFARVESEINSWAAKYNAYLLKYEQDKYLLLLNKESLDMVIETKFSILDLVRELKDGEAFAPTLSIGASSQGENPMETHDHARTAVDVALGRGGDQAVLNVGSDVEYFGGKNKALEKRNKVKARVISDALSQLIQRSDKVFIMGHKNPDMDSVGAGLGMYEACKMQNKEAYIVLNEVVPSIENIYQAVIDYDESYRDVYIDSEEAGLACDNKSLVIVCDTNRKNSTECPELLDITKNIVMIDHHRRGNDFINNAVLTYLESYASSTCEMVTEILFYMKDKLDLPKVVAEALLAGITVDTKNFFYQTGVRTFEAASILKRQGADSIKVKQLFKDDERTIKLKSDVIVNAEVYRNNLAIGILNEDMKESVLIAAQSADDLLNILGIEASFVLTRSKGNIHISGRSLGKISVQLILEKLGGGGHLTSAGAQLSMSIQQAKEKLKQAIDDYLKEEENTDESNSD